MKTQTIDKKLQQLYDHALDRIGFLSAALVDDQQGDDRSTELLLQEAAYAVVCFSRATRKTGTGDLMAPENKGLRHYLEESLQLMGGNGEKRFIKFLNEYFGGSNIRKSAKRLQERIEASIKKGTYQELKADEFFEDEVLDFFLFFDRYACLTHAKDAPINFAKRELKALKPAVDRLFEKLRPAFNTFTGMLTTYKNNVFVPNESAYGYWYILSKQPVEQFIAAAEQALEPAASSEIETFFKLVALLPIRFKNALIALDIEKNIEKYAAMIRRAPDFLRDVALLPFARPRPARVWGAEKKPTAAGKKSKKLTEDSVDFIRSRYGEDFKKEISRIEKNTLLPARERRELAAFASVLAGDQKKLEKLLKLTPAGTKKR